MRFRENEELAQRWLVNKLRVEMSLHLSDFEGLRNKRKPKMAQHRPMNNLKVVLISKLTAALLPLQVIHVTGQVVPSHG